jgi:hypothetical protein
MKGEKHPRLFHFTIKVWQNNSGIGEKLADNPVTGIGIGAIMLPDLRYQSD